MPSNQLNYKELCVKLSDVVAELVEERGLERSVVSDVICEGMLAAYDKKYPDLTLRTSHDKKSDTLLVEIEKSVVSSVSDEDTQITLRRARNIDSGLNIEDTVWVPFNGDIGRIEILRAKQVIANKIRQIESSAIYELYKYKKGSIVHGTIHKCERAGTSIKLDETPAFLPRSLSIPDEKCTPGYPVRALLKDILEEPRHDNQLILDRASKEFVEKLFELDIPEVYERLVEIKKIARAPGYKTKVVVASNDKNIDPIGTCVGVGGVRIKPILKELGSEKIDVIIEGDSTEQFISDSLKPAVVNRVDIDDNTAHVWVDEDQRSLAIGKMGQNISLASELTGYRINLVKNEVAEDKDIQLEENED